MTEPPARTRTITWQDPLIGVGGARSLTGLEFLHAMIDGKLPAPPMSVLINSRLVEAEHGRVVFIATPGEEHYNPIGVVHGGFAATVLDSALGCAVMSVLPVGARYTTVDLNVHLVRGISATTGALRAVGEIVHSGRRIATAQARLTDPAGKLYAHATCTCVILSLDET